jgi:hypothetical protein
MSYVINQHHRNGNRAKSQWRITIPDEKASFENARTNGWLTPDTGWGLHLVNGNAVVLGVAQDHATSVFLAKYVGSASGPWHGYPADYRSNSQDIPTPHVLGEWCVKGLFSAAKIRKISRGQPCNL